MAASAAVGVMAPALWEGVSGRDFRPQATTMAILFVLVGSAFRGAAKWDLKDFIASLIIANFVALAVIGHFSGYGGRQAFDTFNVWWLGFMNIFIGLPWTIGFALGSAILWARNKRAAGRCVP